MNLSIPKFPGHILHEKCLQRQQGAGPLVSSQETKSLFRPADKPLVKRGFRSSIGLHRISLVRASEQSFRTGLFDAFLGGCEGPLSPGRTDLSASRLARPRPAPPPRRAPPRPDPSVVCSGFGPDKFETAQAGHRLSRRPPKLRIAACNCAGHICEHTANRQHFDRLDDNTTSPLDPKTAKAAWTSPLKHKHSKPSVEPKTWIYHLRGGAGAHSGGAGGAERSGTGRGGTAAGRCTQKIADHLATLGTEDDPPGRFFGSTNIRNPIQTQSRNTTNTTSGWRPFDDQLTNGL